VKPKARDETARSDWDKSSLKLLVIVPLLGGDGGGEGCCGGETSPNKSGWSERLKFSTSQINAAGVDI
jgi:hypothetical protein